MRKVIYVLIAPLVTIILLVFKFPNIEAKLNSINAYSFLGIQIFLVIATAFSYYITLYSPYAKYERLAKKRWYLIEIYSTRIRETYKDYFLSFNVMVPKTKYFYSIEPKKDDPDRKKFSFWGKVFKVVWSDGHGVNRQLKITVNQGACGKAYKSGRLIIADLTEAQIPNFNFTKEQIGLTSDIKFIISFPIVSGEEGVDSVNNQVQGVLNVESTSQGSEAIIKDVNFYKELYEFCKICGKLLK